MEDDPVDRLINKLFAGSVGWKLAMAGIVALIGLIILGLRALWAWATSP